MTGGATVVEKLWNNCNVLHDDGLSYQDYLEQLTCPAERVLAREGIDRRFRC